MKEYQLEIRNKHTNTLYHAWAYGEDIDDAVARADYWNADGNKISTDYLIEKVISIKPIDYYPYTYEDAVRMAIENKIPAIHAVLQQDGMADFDQLDLIKVIVNEDPVMFMNLDTACRDKLVDILNENFCDDIIQLIMDFTDPYMDLTEEDAGRLMGEMEAQGYTLPIGFTPKDFIETYKECEPEDEEDEQDD